MASFLVRTTLRGKRVEMEVHDAPAERRGVRYGPPLDGSADALCRTGRSNGKSDPLPPRVRGLVVLVQPGATLAIAVLPRTRARPARARGLGETRVLLHGGRLRRRCR